MSKKILILTRASNKIGLGHIKRCINLGNALKNEGIKVSFSSLENDLVAALCWEAGFEYRVLKEKMNSGISFKKNQFNKYDLLVFDLLQEDLARFNYEEQKVKTAFIYTFRPQELFGEPSIIIYPGVEKLDFDEVQYHKNTVKLYSGPDYIILDPYFSQSEKRAKPFQKVKNILITMGGSDPADLTNALLKCFQDITEKYNINIVAGPGYENLNELQDIANRSHHKCKVYHNLPSLIRLMDKADLVFAPGGTTRFELCALGVPFVLLAFNKKQVRNNAFFIENYNVGFNLGLGGQLTSKKLSSVINRVDSNRHLVHEMSKKGQEIVDGNGLERTKSLITELLGS